ncbi:DEAD/DEAH box helicase [Pseudohoeflea coraliihabitans]|uniref:DEAD/DEAH box helicase n=1 Tax=Pseudohoeflea coraliihabitans TaxID=2860393 RepID=A0ABS6WJL9_9HYPH|nr:DEAD/DEAH box helicase [Pseudohoeflea sp. DP4N28-3]MBW3096139.1 DEAD/DEAH box helicase [Pseudohoeflea sp. DP4N28-3]
MSFDTLGLSRPILDALTALSITTPTPIQEQAIPTALAGHDLVGLAQTGTGKTAAFSLPILEKLSSGGRAAPCKTRALILSPTRELASQIHKSIRDFSRRLKLRSVLAVGGVSIRPQMKFLAGGADILIATPGRLEDLIRQNAVSLDETHLIVLDEADQMLDIGFMPAIRRVFGMLPQRRQTMLFSATMPKEIRQLSQKYLREPVEISVVPATRTADRIEQGVIHISNRAKTTALTKVIEAHDGNRVIVFTRTKHGANKVVQRLEAAGIRSSAIHGNKSQGQRERALEGFRRGSIPVLIATDIAARGIDVPGVSLVVNHDLPDVPEVYIHRIGRTARAGASGEAISLCAPDERSQLRDIERLIKLSVPVLPAPEGLQSDDLAAEADMPAPRQGRGPKGRNGGGRGNGRPGNNAGGNKGPHKHRRPGGPRKPGEANAGTGEGGRAAHGAPGNKLNRRPKRRKSGGQNGGQRPAVASA